MFCLGEDTVLMQYCVIRYKYLYTMSVFEREKIIRMFFLGEDTVLLQNCIIRYKYLYTMSVFSKKIYKDVLSGRRHCSSAKLYY